MKTIVFHIHSLLAGGIEKVLIEILSALPKDKYNIRLLITYEFGKAEVLRPLIPNDIPVEYLLPQSILTRTHVKKKTGKVSAIEKVFSELFIAPFKKNVLKKRLREAVEDADLIIDFDMTLAPLHKVIADKKKIAYCHFSLNHYLDGNARKLSKLAHRLSHYDKVVMLCDEMKEEAAQLFPFLAPKLLRIYNAVDFNRIQTMAAEPLDKAAIPFLQQGYIVSVGRLQEGQKDFTTLIKAYAQAVRQYAIGEALVIVGDGGSRATLEALTEALGIKDKVYFAGFQNNPYKWMAQSKMLLFSSRYEGLPTVLIEALSLGKPVVATACPTGVRELLLDGYAGILTPVGDIAAMADAIYRLIYNPVLQEKQRNNAALFLQNFSISHTIQETQSLLFEGLN